MYKAPWVLYPWKIYSITPLKAILSTILLYTSLWTHHPENGTPGVFTPSLHIMYTACWVLFTLGFTPSPSNGVQTGVFTPSYVHSTLSTVSLGYTPHHPMLCTKDPEYGTPRVLTPSSHVMYTAPWVLYPWGIYPILCTHLPEYCNPGVLTQCYVHSTISTVPLGYLPYLL